MTRRFFRPIITMGMAILLVLLQVTSVHSQASIQSIRVMHIDAQDFPDVAVQFFAYSPRGIPLSSVNASDIKLVENQVEIPDFSLGSKEVGIQVAFVIDAGLGINALGSRGNTTRFQQANEIINEYVTTGRWMRSGLDATLILAQTGGDQSVMVAPMSTDASAVATGLREFEPATYVNSCAGLRGVVDALDQLHSATTGPEQQKFVIALIQCEGLDTSVSETIVKKSLEYNIPVHFLLLRGTSDEYRFETLLELAEQTGGSYQRYVRLDDVTNDLFPLLASYRTQLTLTYGSQVSQSGEYTVTLTTNTGAIGSPSNSKTYLVDIADPVVLITYPQTGGNSVAVCQSAGYNAASCSVSPKTVTVTAQVDWPDEHPRDIVSAQLQVNGRNVGIPVTPTNQTQIEIPWDLSDHKIITDTYSNVQIVIEDELGRTTTSDPVQALIAGKPCPFGGGDSVICVVWPYMSFLNIGLSLFAIGLAVFVWFNRGKVVKVAKEGASAVVDFVERVTKRRSAMEVRAWLVALDGMDDSTRKEFEIYGTTPIGRSRQHSDLVLQADDENSALSRLHATLLDEGDRFIIRDEDSANGTYLNGVKLLPLEPEEVRDGDQIEFGQVQRGGLLFRFSTRPPGGDIPRGPSSGRPMEDEYTHDSNAMDEDFRETRPRKSPGGANVVGNDEDFRKTRPRKMPNG